MEISARTRRARARRRIAAALPANLGNVIAVALALLVGGAGIADAATGGNFILGKANSESSTASLSNSAGTPLSLAAPSGKAPLAVNSKTLVKNLNAASVGGLSSAQLQSTGGDGITVTNVHTLVNSTVTTVASTGALPAGIYYVSATALLSVASGDSGGFCYIATGSKSTAELSLGGGDVPQGFMQAAETAAVSLTAGDTLLERCYTGGANGSFVYDAGLTAIRIRFSSGTAPSGQAPAGGAGAPSRARD